jgi:hydroxymethylpyrimidine pyrophosphatase-like HAD family hydrolase
MRYRALASDYDDTLATRGQLAPATEAAMRRLAASGRKLLLVTGRLLEDIERVCPALPMFDAVVAENGAVLSIPATGEIRQLAAPPPPAFAAALRARGVAPVVEGRVIVATYVREARAVDEVIRSLGLSMHMILNRQALMVLPSGVDKGSGLAAGLAEVGVALEAAVAVGDAENDRPMLQRAGLGVAVANALPSIRDVAKLVTAGSAGEGVAELCAHLLEQDP